MPDLPDSTRAVWPPAPFAVLAEIEGLINSAGDLSPQQRSERGALLSANLRRYARSPAVDALMRRVLTELMGVSGEFVGSVLSAPDAEPEARTWPDTFPPVDGTPQQSAILLYGDPDNEDEVTAVYVINGDTEGARRIGESLATLRGGAYVAHPITPVPPEVSATERLDAVRQVAWGPVINEQDMNEALARIRSIVGR